MASIGRLSARSAHRFRTWAVARYDATTTQPDIQHPAAEAALGATGSVALRWLTIRLTNSSDVHLHGRVGPLPHTSSPTGTIRSQRIDAREPTGVPQGWPVSHVAGVQEGSESESLTLVAFAVVRLL